MREQIWEDVFPSYSIGGKGQEARNHFKKSIEALSVDDVFEVVAGDVMSGLRHLAGEGFGASFSSRIRVPPGGVFCVNYESGLNKKIYAIGILSTEKESFNEFARICLARMNSL